MKKEELNYESAYYELKEIVQEIEKGDISVDTLSDKVKRAGFLIEFCQKKLRETESDVDKILKELNKEENSK